VIPGNDDAIRSAQLMATVIAEAAREGRELAEAKASKTSEDGDTGE
jgi:ribosomal protein S2